MPAIRNREDENRRRKDRIKDTKRGPGWFRYLGNAKDTEYTPTFVKRGRDTPVLDSDGLPVVDSNGNQLFEKAGAVVKDSNGKPVLGGVPKRKEIPIKIFSLRGVDFPAGEPVFVKDTALALKMRGMNSFDEVEEAEVSEIKKKAREQASKNQSQPHPSK